MRDSKEEQPPAGEGRYWAFVSYSHADARFAHWLHRQLERYRLPAEPAAPRRRVFIDRAELAAGTDLSAEVRAALTRSDALVVVASPAAQAGHAPSQSLLAFILDRFRARMRFFPMLQQCLAIFALLVNDRVVMLMIRAFSGGGMAEWQYWIAPAVGTLAWPWLFLALDVARQRGARAREA